MTLAERGSMRPVHEYIDDLASGIRQNDADGPYKQLTTDDDDHQQQIAFQFGKTVFKDRSQFAKEDIAASLLYTMASDLVQCVHTALRAHPQVRRFSTP